MVENPFPFISGQDAFEAILGPKDAEEIQKVDPSRVINNLQGRPTDKPLNQTELKVSSALANCIGEGIIKNPTEAISVITRLQTEQKRGHLSGNS